MQVVFPLLSDGPVERREITILTAFLVLEAAMRWKR